MSDIIDGALARIHHAGPELIVGGPNHGPMGAETLVTLGLDERDVMEWIDDDRARRAVASKIDQELADEVDLQDVESREGLHLLYVDGSLMKDAEGEEPRRGAIGVLLKDPSGREVLARHAEPIDGLSHPHEAEYHALIAGLQLAQDHDPPIEYVAVMSDSRVMVNQVNGLWKARPPLDDLLTRVQELIARFPSTGIQVSWVPREWNSAHRETEGGYGSS